MAHKPGDIIVFKTPYYAELTAAQVINVKKSGSPEVLNEYGTGLKTPGSTVLNITNWLDNLGLKIIKKDE